MIKKCLECDKEFKVYSSALKRGKGKYCSRSCSTPKRVSINCGTCNKQFTIPPSKIKAERGKFCSRKCYEVDWNSRIPGWNKGKPATWMIGNTIRLGVTNENPNRMFGEDNPKWIKDRTKLKGHNSDERRSSAYVIWRKSVCERDKWKCKLSDETCSKKLEVHHIFSFTEYPELRHDINNGITLCKKHHPRKRKDELRLQKIFKKLIAD